jgi:hypothetical protein
MDFTDTIHTHLAGDAQEQARRGQLLQNLLAAFGRGGREAVQQEVAKRLAELAEALDARLNVLREKF